VGQKILVVEDNELNLKLFCDLLGAHGYEAEPVRDGRDALERARAFAPDLVVMDIQMPHISGLELIEQMKSDAELRATPIMAVTAYAARGDEERIRDAGAEGYVSKPISVVRFVEAVAGLLTAAAERAQAEPKDAVAEEEPTDEPPPPVTDEPPPETTDAAEHDGEAASDEAVGDEEEAPEPVSERHPDESMP
jgi:two-component system cell cycle response regulator DivK